MAFVLSRTMNSLSNSNNTTITITEGGSTAQWEIGRVVSVSYDEDDHILTSSIIVGQKRLRELNMTATSLEALSNKIARVAKESYAKTTVKSSLHLANLTDNQCRKLLSNYFGIVLSSQESVTGTQLMSVNSTSCLQELGLGHLPLAKQRRIIDELQTWREMKCGFLPQSLAQMLSNVSIHPADNPIVLVKENFPSNQVHPSDSMLNEDVLIFLCQGKVLSERIDIGNFRTTIDTTKITPSQLQHAAHLYRALDAWSTMIAILREEPSFARLALLLAAGIALNAPTLTDQQIATILPVMLQLFDYYQKDAKMICAFSKQIKGLVFSKVATSIVQSHHVEILINSLNYFSHDVSMVQVIGEIIKSLPATDAVDQVLLRNESVYLLIELLDTYHLSSTPCLPVVKLLIGILKYVAIKCGECEIHALTQVHLKNPKYGLGVTCHRCFCQCLDRVCTLLVSVLTTFSSNASVVKHACQVISCLCSSTSLLSSNVSQRFHESKVENALLLVLKHYHSKTLSLIPILSAAFSLVATSPCTKNAMVEANEKSLLPELISVLRDNTGCAQVIEQACRLLAIVASVVPAMVVDQQLPSLLLELMSLYRENGQVVEQIVVVASVLDGNLLLEAKTFPIVLSVLRDSSTVSTVQRLLLVVKTWLRKHQETKQSDDEVMMVIPVVMEALQHHGSQSITVACEVIAILTVIIERVPSVASTAEQQASITEQLFILLKGVHFFPVMAKLFAHRTMEIDLVVSVCDLLAIVLKKFPQSSTLFEPAKLVLSVITLMMIHKRCETVVLAAMKVLRVTSVPHSLLTERNCQRFVGALQELLLFHGLNQPIIVNHICWLIVSLGMPILNQLDEFTTPVASVAIVLTATQGLSLKSSSPFVGIMMELLSKYITSSETTTYLFWVIANITMQKFCVAKKFCEAGIHSFIYEAVCRYQRLPKVMKYVVHTMKGLSSYSSLIDDDLLDCSMFNFALETLFPLYNKHQTVMPPLCSTLNHLIRFDAKSIDNKSIFLLKTVANRSWFMHLFTEGLSHFQERSVNTNSHSCTVCTDIQNILSLLSSSKLSKK